MGLFLARVYVWRDLRDSSNRIAASERENGRLFILNTNRVTEVKDLSTLAAPRCSFYYADNLGDRRESLSYIECNLSASQLIAQFDVTPASQAVTLPVCPWNNPYQGNPVFPLRTPVNITIGIWAIAYVTRYNPDPTNYVWVCYYKGSYKRMEVLVSLDVEMYPTLTTTTTTTTTEER